MEGSSRPSPTKDQIVETIIDIFVRVIGFIEREEVSASTHPARDLRIDTDDLSVFASEVVKHFAIKPTPEEWFRDAGTMEEIAALVLRHLSEAGPQARPDAQ